MANHIKRSGADGLALQVTTEAREAGLVVERGNDRVDRADVRVYAFDGLLLVVDRDLADDHVAEFVAAATRDTESIHRALDATITPAVSNAPNAKTIGSISSRNSSNTPWSEPLIR